MKKTISLLLHSKSLYWDWWIKNEEIKRGFVPYLFEKCIENNGTTALDIGCGNCFYTDILRDNGFNVECIDKSKSALKICNEKNYEFEQQDIKNLKLKKHYDIISCMGVLHHITNDDSVIKILNEIKSHCTYFIVGVMIDCPNSFKFKYRPVCFYNDILNGYETFTNSYLILLTSMYMIDNDTKERVK